MYQSYPPSGSQPTQPLRPHVPPPVLTAVKLMRAGAAISAVYTIILLAIAIGDIKAAAHWQWRGHSLTMAQLSQLKPLIITVVLVSGLVVIALWLWMARANGEGRNWARILSTVLFGLATLQLTGAFRQPVIHTVPSAEVLGLLGAVLAWLPGLAAVWLLWQPASSAFFKPQGFTQARYSA